jgi:hypothetical protein
MTVEMTRPTEATTILQRCVCLTLRCSWLGNDRKVKNEKVVEAAHGTTALDPTAVRAAVKLVDQKALRGPNRVISAAKAQLRRWSISAHRVFGERTYLVPVENITRVDQMLRAAVEELAVEAQLVAADYGRLMNEQEWRLGPALFDRRRYLTADQVAQEWSIDWEYVSFAAPERLETADRAVYEASVQKWDAKLSEAYAEVRVALCEELRWFTGEFAKRLAPTADGKVKVVHGQALLDNLREFLDGFQLRNVTDHADLAAAVAEVRRLTAGVDGRMLNDDEALRASFRTAMAEATTHLDGLIVTGRRGIRLGPSPAGAGRAA